MCRLIALMVLVLVLALVGCSDQPKAIKDFNSWWSSLSKDQQECILRDNPGRDETPYRVRLQDEDSKLTDMVEFRDWVNGLTPSQIEAYESHRLQTQTDQNLGIDGNTTIRVPPCLGTWIRSSDCQPGMPKIANDKCLRCVPGIKESKP